MAYLETRMTVVERVLGIEDGTVTAPEGSLIALVRSHAGMLERQRERQVEQGMVLEGVRSTLVEHTAVLKNHTTQLVALRTDVGELKAGQRELRADLGDLKAEVVGLRSDTRRIIELITDLATGEWPKR